MTDPQVKQVQSTKSEQKPTQKQGPYQILHSGDKFPLVGFGTWKLPNEITEDIVYEAIKVGYRHIDCAAVYGNEVEVGRGINKAINDNIVRREQLFITSKLWNTNHRKQHVKPAFERSLTDLNLQYLDLYLMHYPLSLKYVDPSVVYPALFYYQPKGQKDQIIMDDVPIMETWKAMEELVKEGLVRNIGVSNFGIALLRDLINGAGIVPAVNQIEVHPYLTSKNLLKYCKMKGVQVTSYSTLGGMSYLELDLAQKQELITDTEVIKYLSTKYGKSSAQIIFRWAIQQGLSIIPKTSKKERLKQNIEISQWQLSEDDMKEIDKLNKNKRYCDPKNFIKEEDVLEILVWDD